MPDDNKNSSVSDLLDYTDFSVKDLLDKKFSEIPPKYVDHCRQYFIDRSDEIKRFANIASEQFNKSLFIMNAGGAVTLLGYFGAIAESNYPFALNISLIMFLFGLLTSVLYANFEFKRHVKHYKILDDAVRDFYDDKVTYYGVTEKESEAAEAPKHVTFLSFSALIFWCLGILIGIYVFLDLNLFTEIIEFFNDKS